MNKEREAFEAWYFSKHYAGTTACRLKVFEKFENLKGVEKPYNGEYINDRVILAWDAWQAAKAEAVQEWISVEDRLPKNNTLVAWINFRPESGILEKWISVVDSIGWADCYDGYHRKVAKIDATHWMPLPDALQEQTHDN